MSELPRDNPEATNIKRAFDTLDDIRLDEIVQTIHAEANRHFENTDKTMMETARLPSAPGYPTTGARVEDLMVLELTGNATPNMKVGFAMDIVGLAETVADKSPFHSLSNVMPNKGMDVGAADNLEKKINAIIRDQERADHHAERAEWDLREVPLDDAPLDLSTRVNLHPGLLDETGRDELFDVMLHAASRIEDAHLRGATFAPLKELAETYAADNVVTAPLVGRYFGYAEANVAGSGDRTGVLLDAARLDHVIDHAERAELFDRDGDGPPKPEGTLPLDRAHYVNNVAALTPRELERDIRSTLHLGLTTDASEGGFSEHQRRIYNDPSIVERVQDQVRFLESLRENGFDTFEIRVHIGSGRVEDLSAAQRLKHTIPELNYFAQNQGWSPRWEMPDAERGATRTRILEDVSQHLDPSERSSERAESYGYDPY